MHVETSGFTEQAKISMSRHDLTVKLYLDRNALGVLELLTNIGLPLLALLIALIIWNTRRH